ncbi:MAG: hypothetical protein K2O58_07620 [Bacteroidales bacterium]|nr:hypothetical protein [Bacteroidales bacterium]
MQEKTFIQEIAAALESHGVKAVPTASSGHGLSVAAMPLIKATGASGHSTLLLPVDIESRTPEDAARQSMAIAGMPVMLQGAASRPAMILRDRWERQKETTLSRILAHCGVYTQVFARNCEVRRIEKGTAQAFMAENHSYGGASCRYCYGLYVKRYSGKEMTSEVHRLPVGSLIAAAEFSNARKWTKGEKEIRSYEWIRYASLPGVRVSGGMGKILRQFIGDISPDDIMSYADLEWSDGNVYRQLGFIEDGTKSPVLFAIDPQTWERTPVKADIPQDTSGSGRPDLTAGAGKLWYRNQGSIKYRLKLTDW